MNDNVLQTESEKPGFTIIQAIELAISHEFEARKLSLIHI